MGADRDHAAGYSGEPSNGQGTLNFIHVIAARHGRPKMPLMQPIRTSARWLRLALAMLFAVVTLIQVPAMAVAYATAPARSVAVAPHDAHHHNSHSHHRDHAPQASDSAQDASVCQAMGCCVVAIDPAVICAPAATCSLLGLVDIPPARVMLPAFPEPADPPPRLQV
jgi:hypothetical protein